MTTCTKRECVLCGKGIPKEKRLDAKYCSDKCGGIVRSRRYYKNNPALFKEKRDLENSDIPRRILYRIRNRAKTMDIPFDLELEDIVVPDVCPVLGIKIQTITGGGANQYGSPSVDRIYPDKGYVRGNIRIISNRANLLKSNATIEELEAVLADLKGLYQ